MKYIALLITAIVIFSCTPEAPTPPCDGDCGIIVGSLSPTGAFILVTTPSGNLQSIDTHFRTRIENDCSGERADFVIEMRYGDYVTGDEICNYQ